MKKNSLFLLLFVFTSLSFAQNFEGKITYKNVYDSKNPQVTDHQWDVMMGTKQEYYYKNGNYKSVVNGTLIQWQLYLQNKNKIYTKMVNSDTAFATDASIKNDSVLSYTINKRFTAVLGHTCDELVLTCTTGIQKYYFSEHCKIDALLFQKHLYGNWYEYLKLSNALPLMMIIQNQQYELTSTAIEIEEKKLNISIFEEPKNLDKQVPK